MGHDRPYGLRGEQNAAVAKSVERLKFGAGHLRNDLFGTAERHVGIVPRVDDKRAAAARLQELRCGEGTQRPTADPLEAMLECASHGRIEIPVAREVPGYLGQAVGTGDK